MEKNYKSDFDIILTLKTCVRNEDGTCSKRDVGWPEHDWVATFRTDNGLREYVASRKGDTLVNCFNDNGRIHVVFNNHRLGKGVLRVDFHSEIPNAIYPDGIQDLYEPQPLDVELVDGPGDCAGAAEVEVLLPYIKGEKGDAFTYADFTPAQIAELQRPATEKVAEVTQALTRVEDQEREITAAEQIRQSNETLRQTNETQRSTAEQERAKQFAALKHSIETATTSADTAAENAQTASNTANAAANLANAAASNIAAAKRALFDDMWASINGTKLANGNYRKGADGKELTYAEALVRYERNGFICRWNKVCEYFTDSYKPKVHGCYNESTGYFELNGITDIGYEEAVRIYLAYVSDNVPKLGRTNIPVGRRYYGEPSANPNGFTNTKIEIMAGSFSVSDLQIYNSHTIREINKVYATDAINRLYVESMGLEIIYFTAQNKNAKQWRLFNIKNASKFRLDGMEEILKWVRDSTVTVHPDVYAKLTGDTTNEAAAALTEEELAQWMAITEAAAAKNISFATV